MPSGAPAASTTSSPAPAWPAACRPPAPVAPPRPGGAGAILGAFATPAHPGEDTARCFAGASPPQGPRRAAGAPPAGTMTGRRPPPGTANDLEGQQMTWIAAAQQERREQIGRFLLGTGGIGGIARATGLGLGLSATDGPAPLHRP